MKAAAMTPAEARAALSAAGLTIADLVATLVDLGDKRKPKTIVRCCQMIFSEQRDADAEVPWAVWLMLHYIDLCKKLIDHNKYLAVVSHGKQKRPIIRLAPAKKAPDKRRQKRHDEQNASLSRNDASACTGIAQSSSDERRGSGEAN